MKELTWVAIGDSFTFIDNHLEESGYRITKGYLTRTKEKLIFNTKLINFGINGGSTKDFLDINLIPADFYTILLGTNDWWGSDIQTGTKEDFLNYKKGTILGNLGVLIKKIKDINKDSLIFVMNPIERGMFVYLYDMNNNALITSNEEHNGRTLKEIADAIYTNVNMDNVIPINLHDESQITVESSVKFFRIKEDNKIIDFPYPDYLSIAKRFNPKTAIYPYPIEASNDTYDGLHPSDKGCEKISNVLAKHINDYFSNNI